MEQYLQQKYAKSVICDKKGLAKSAGCSNVRDGEMVSAEKDGSVKAKIRRERETGRRRELTCVGDTGQPDGRRLKGCCHNSVGDVH